MSSNQPQRRERGGLGAGRRVEKRWREMGRGVEKRIVLSLAVQSATSSITMASGSPTFHHIELLNASDATMSAWADTVPPLTSSPATPAAATPAGEAAATPAATPAGEAAATPADGEAAAMASDSPTFHHIELLNGSSDATMSAWADTVPPLTSSPATPAAATPAGEAAATPAATPAGEAAATPADGEAAATPAGEAAVEEPPVTIHVWGHPSWKWLGPISRTPWKSPTTVHLHEHGSEVEARSVAPR